MTEKQEETLPEWELVYTFRTRVRARTLSDAADAGQLKLDRREVEMTDMRCQRVDEFFQIAQADATVVRSRNSPIEVLKKKAGEECTWCWWTTPCVKDPTLGWVHIDTDEYRSRGGRALHVCEAQEISEDIFELEEVERKSA